MCATDSVLDISQPGKLIVDSDAIISLSRKGFNIDVP